VDWTCRNALASERNSTHNLNQHIFQKQNNNDMLPDTDTTDYNSQVT
jgi:hypothetical protein